MPSQQTPRSRYANLPTRTATLADGKVIDVLSERPLPEPVDPLSAEARWAETLPRERLDEIADRLWDAPTEYWRLMDATTALQVRELEAPDEHPDLPAPTNKILLPREG